MVQRKVKERKRADASKESEEKSRKTSRVVLYTVLVMILAAMPLAFMHILWPHFVWKNEPAHSTVEALGALP